MMERMSGLCAAGKTIVIKDGKIVSGCTRRGCISYPCEFLKRMGVEEDPRERAETQEETGGKV